MSFSLQQAYDAAGDGTVVSVPAGLLTTDSPGRDSVTIFGDGPKRVTFVAQDPVGIITHASKVFTIKAPNVKIIGPGWHLHDLRVGEGGDDWRTASGVVIEDVRCEGLEIVGCEATLRRCAIGRSTLCYAQGTTGTGRNGGVISPAMCCDPAVPEEAFWADKGSGSDSGSAILNNQTFIHENSAGVPGEALFEECVFEGIQTKDAFNLHTGAMLVWNPPGATIRIGADGLEYGQVTIRRCQFRGFAVQGIQISSGDGFVLEDSVFSYPVEPLSNPNGGSETGPEQKELKIRGVPGALVFRHARIRRNRFCHGTRSAIPVEDVIFEDNDLGRADEPWGGASYARNSAEGSGCAGTAPPPPPPPPSCVAPTLVAGRQTDQTCTLTWQPIPGATGYRFYKNGLLVSSAGAAATSVKFGNLPYGSTLLGVAAICPDGEKLATVKTVEIRTVVIG
jgi:hypothetical protein